MAINELLRDIEYMLFDLQICNVFLTVSALGYPFYGNTTIKTKSSISHMTFTISDTITGNITINTSSISDVTV